MTEQYIEKSITTESGAVALVWDGTILVADLETGEATVSLAGYADEATMVEGGQLLKALDIEIEDVRAFTNYENVFNELSNWILTQEVEVESEVEGEPPTKEPGKWNGGQVVTLAQQGLGRIIKKPVETQSGAVAEAWRSGKLVVKLKKGVADMHMVGYKDQQSFSQGKPEVTGLRPFRVTVPLADISTYDALYNEILTYVMTGTVLEGGVVKQVGA